MSSKTVSFDHSNNTLVPEVFLEFSSHDRAEVGSHRRQGQDLTLGLGLVDIFTSTQINMIGSFDWQYRRDSAGDICHCTSCGNVCLSIPGKEFVSKILHFSVYIRSRFVRVSDSVFEEILTLALEERFPEIESLTERQSRSHNRKHVLHTCPIHPH